MSVSLISEKLGHFDNVIYSHPQYINNPDILYQMCRCYFNYINWNNKNIKKKTIIHTDFKEQIDICMRYEKQIDEINKMESSLKTLDEVQGDIKYKKEKPKKPKDEIFNKLKNNQLVKFGIKEFDIPTEYEEIENCYWERIKICFKEIKGHIASTKSLPSKNDEGFYTCSTTDKCKVFQKDKLKEEINKLKKYSSYQFQKNTYNYARLYLGYNDISNIKKGYTVFLRYIQFTECEEVDNFISHFK